MATQKAIPTLPHAASLALPSPQTLDMGSKMSFGRGSSDQNAASELTCVTPLPCSSFHAPSDCKQTPNSYECSEGDLNACREDKMKADLNVSVPQSNSSERVESDGNVSSEAGKNCQQSEYVSPQVRLDEGPPVTSTSNRATKTRKRRGAVRRKRGRSGKIKALTTGHVKSPDAASQDGVRSEELDGTAPLPACTVSHSNEVPSAVDGNPTSALPHSEVPVPGAALKETAGSDGPLVVKKKRGRPKKSETAPSENRISKKVAPAPAVPNPAWTLRSRGGLRLSTEDGLPNPKEDLKQTEGAPRENSTTSHNRSVKRRRAKCTDQQVPAKVSKLDDSQEASPCLSNDKEEHGGSTEADKQVELISDTQEANADANVDQFSLLSGKVQEQREQLKDESSPQQELQSQREPEVIPPEDLNSLNELKLTKEAEDPEVKQSVSVNGGDDSLSKMTNSPGNVESQRDEPSRTDAVISAKETLQSEEKPSKVKAENTELELDHSNSPSQPNSPKIFQPNAKSEVKPEGPKKQQTTLRRRRGGKRRRRKHNALIQKENLVEKHDEDIEQKADCQSDNREVNSDDNANVIYTKKGGKTVLKCGYCGRVFKFLSQFVIHQRIHTGERPFKCPECGKGFSKNSNLNLHLKTHIKNSLYQNCQLCKLKFSPSEYVSHIKMKHAPEPDQETNNIKSEKAEPEKARGEGNQENGQGLPKPAAPEKKDKKVCQYCGKTFPFQSALVRHVRVHTGEKPYKCDICGKAFGQAYFLRVHELTHWSVKRYNCTRCEKSFTHYSNAKNHTCRPVESRDALHPNRLIKPSLTYTCHICKNVFEHLHEFNSHMREHTGAKLYHCLYCDKLFGTLSEFNGHRSGCTAERSTSGHLLKEEEMMTLIQYTVPALRCSSGPPPAPVKTLQSETQKKPAHISRRKRSVNVKKPFLSTVAPPHQISHLVLKLNKLDNRSDPRKYLCPSCGRQFRHMGRLRAHMLTHAPGQSYTCACCGKTLGSWRKLWHHQRVHRQRSGRFTCPECGRGFRFVGPYRNHMSEHPEFHWIQNRPTKTFLPYQCEQCRCSFKTLDLLFSHQRCHSSAQDLHKDSDFDLLIDECSPQPIKKMLSPPSNNNLPISAERNGFPLSRSHKYPDPACERSPLVPMISSAHSQGLDSDNSAQHPGRTLSVQDRETRPDRINEYVSRNRKKSCLNQSNSKSNEGSSDDVKCAVCGNAFPAISDLYHHYLQHARGQL